MTLSQEKEEEEERKRESKLQHNQRPTHINLCVYCDNIWNETAVIYGLRGKC